MGCALFANICYKQEVAKLKFYDGTYTAYDGTVVACDGKKFVVGNLELGICPPSLKPSLKL